ncbi:putative translation factor SUA5 family protein [Selenomonas ruminantium subsp. lactilytica TAM6421]|uniref:Threonylcarbamoyl-AMP synthase n=1 Tax=Selenomonas ruminantium subsp. lactilytica (strain NBRC 103574 / TAM6421) TaxID=927704 RepID=I0GMR3_SELRL|nr:L-threonylcarbamoyladenylate synthase [Selenomonas ruminantium]BAL82050.1 putative translation factor SUA5 family protein [Selenomonas ruminantium subsp. lactilytica TAM6421]
MQTRCIRIDNITAGKEALHFAGELIRQGEVVAFPTETVYGLGANGLDAAACRKIYQAKGRPSDNPLILHVANRSMIDQVAARIPEKAEKLIAAFCPGPITLILPRKAIVPEQITGGLSTVGVRMPEHDVARALIAAAGVPIAAPSANISGRPSPTTAESVLVDMEGKIPMILDGGACDFGVESTIVDATGEKAVILRPGAITKEMLEEVLGEGSVVIDPALVGADSVPKAPGMKYTHYAPKAPLTLIEGMPTRMVRAFQREIARLQDEGHTVGVIASHEVLQELKDTVPADLQADYGHQGQLPAIAANIYEALRSFDEKGADVLLGEGTTSEGLGLAIMNRLHKASGFRTIQA